jgi:hypothetical protein
VVCAPAAPLPPGGTHRRECITGAFAPAYGFSFLQIYCGLWLILFPHPAPTNAQVLGLAKGYFQKWMNATKAEAAVREQKGQALVWVSQVLTLRNDGKMVARSSLPLARTAHWRLTPPPSRPSSPRSRSCILMCTAVSGASHAAAMGVSRKSRTIPAPSPAMGVPLLSPLGLVDLQVPARVCMCRRRIFKCRASVDGSCKITGDATRCRMRFEGLTQCSRKCSFPEGHQTRGIALSQPRRIVLRSREYTF